MIEDKIVVKNSNISKKFKEVKFVHEDKNKLNTKNKDS